MSGRTALYLLTFSRYPPLNFSKLSQNLARPVYITGPSDRIQGEEGDGGDAFGRLDYFCILRDRLEIFRSGRSRGGACNRIV